VFYICIGTVVKFILDSFINNKQIKKTHNMEKNIFTSKETTKEQYLKFKDYIKSDADKDHADYVAYYILKHRIVGEERDKYLEDEVRHRCYKMLVTGRFGYGGGDCVEREAIPFFKNAVITRYNKRVETDD
jgi:hypothetical protein